MDKDKDTSYRLPLPAPVIARTIGSGTVLISTFMEEEGKHGEMRRRFGSSIPVDRSLRARLTLVMIQRAVAGVQLHGHLGRLSPVRLREIRA